MYKTISLPNLGKFAPVGLEMGISLLTIFLAALELLMPPLARIIEWFPIVLLFCSLSGKSFLLLYDLASSIMTSKSFPNETIYRLYLVLADSFLCVRS